MNWSQIVDKLTESKIYWENCILCTFFRHPIDQSNFCMIIKFNEHTMHNEMYNKVTTIANTYQYDEEESRNETNFNQFYKILQSSHSDIFVVYLYFNAKLVHCAHIHWILMVTKTVYIQVTSSYSISMYTHRSLTVVSSGMWYLKYRFVSKIHQIVRRYNPKSKSLGLRVCMRAKMKSHTILAQTEIGNSVECFNRKMVTTRKTNIPILLYNQ